jgi:hypothetical protein
MIAELVLDYFSYLEASKMKYEDIASHVSPPALILATATAKSIS